MLSIFPVSGLPIIAPGDRLVDLLADRLRPLGPRQGDVLVVTSKIVSKAEGRFVNLRTVTPGTEARTLAAKVDKDPRLVQVILDESAAVSRARGRVLIMRHRLGFICANAGVDHSNTSTDPDIVLLLPKDPDASARALRDGLAGLPWKSLNAVVWLTNTAGVVRFSDRCTPTSSATSRAASSTASSVECTIAVSAP